MPWYGWIFKGLLYVVGQLLPKLWKGKDAEQLERKEAADMAKPAGKWSDTVDKL